MNNKINNIQTNLLTVINKILKKKTIKHYFFVTISIFYLSLVLYLAFKFKTWLDTAAFLEAQNQHLLDQLNNIEKSIEELQILQETLDKQIADNTNLLNNKICKIKESTDESEMLEEKSYAISLAAAVFILTIFAAVLEF